MFKSKWNIVLVLVACALLLPATVSAKIQAEQPFMIQGNVTVTFDPYYASATGYATYIGKYSSSAKVPGKAILIAENGDQLFWDEESWDVVIPNPPPNTITFGMKFTITGGTGRFEGASGSFGPVTVTADLTATGCTFRYMATGTIVTAGELPQGWLEGNMDLDNRFVQTVDNKDLDGVMGCVLNSPYMCWLYYGTVTWGWAGNKEDFRGWFNSFEVLRMPYSIDSYWKFGDTVFTTGTGVEVMTNTGADPIVVPIFATSVRQLVDGKWVYLMIDISAPPTPAPTVVSEEALPAGFSLIGSFPNPFNPSATIQYTISAGRSEHLTLKVYDLRGALVKTLVDGIGHPGNYSVLWDGRDQTGNSVSSGMYFYRLQAGAFTESRKMLLLR